MNLPTRDFATLVRDMSAVITSSSGRLIDTSIGSVLRAIIEANAAIGLWVQWLILLTLQTTRAATSSGSDLDSWVGDFALSRHPAVPASGVATFSRFSGINVAFLPAGTIIKTQDGSVSFFTVADPLNSAWQPPTNAYCFASGVTAIELPIIAVVAGSSGNVLASTITLVASAVPGIDLVSNRMPTYGGGDIETDDALRGRFADYFSARSRATKDAVGYAISVVGPDLNYLIRENVDAAGNSRAGNIVIIVDDGTGLLPASLFNRLSQAVDEVRPLGTTFSILAPDIVPVQVGLALEFAGSSPIISIQDSLITAVSSYINKRPIGAALSLTRISQLVYAVRPDVTNISDVTLNGQQEDLVVSPTGSIKFAGISFI